MEPVTGSAKPLRLGQTASIARTFNTADVQEYIALTGDPDPALRAGSPAVPHVLLAALFSQILGMKLPGQGANYLKQWLSFPDTAWIGEEIRATVEVIRIRPEKQLVNLSTVCSAGDRVVCEGEALVLVKDVSGAIESSMTRGNSANV